MDPAWSAVDTAVKHNLKLGTWTNWSRGKVLGATLTLSRENGNLLIAFTALFIGLVSSRVWRIACLLFHRWYSTSEPRDALHHQRQAILRNAASAEVGFMSFVQLSWAWRRTARHYILNTLPMIVFSIVCSVGFIVASGFSSRISITAGNEVLVDGTNCSLIADLSQLGTLQAAQDVYPYRASILNSAANYAQQCYSSNGSDIFDCSTFVTSQLPGTIDAEAPCPFEANICRTNTSNILLDTGYVDSHTHLGLNAPDNERMLFRHVFHCAPLITEGHTSRLDLWNESLVRYHYGSSVGTPNGNLTTLDFTYEARSLDSQYTRQSALLTRSYNYELGYVMAVPVNGSVAPESLYQPMPELLRPDGSLYIIFLEGNGVAFYEATDDDWYRGNVAAHVTTSLGERDLNDLTTLYKPEEAASPMACVEQYQFCRVDDTNCGPLASFYDAVMGAAPLFNATRGMLEGEEDPTSKSAAQFGWFTNRFSLAATSVEWILNGLGARGLASQLALQNGIQGPMPTNQWQLDVRHWWAIWLASIQAGFVNMARGTDDPVLKQYAAEPDQFRQDVCETQKIRSSMVVSFSLFALYFTLIVGLLLILTDLILEPIFDCLQRRKGYKQYESLEWTTNGVLQLQRLGYESSSSGTWSHCTDTVPITNPDEPLVYLNLDDPLHPQLGLPAITEVTEVKWGESPRDSHTEEMEVAEGNSNGEQPRSTESMV